MRRHVNGPILTRHDVPDVPPRLVDATSVFNPGAASWRGRSSIAGTQSRGRYWTLGLQSAASAATTPMARDKRAGLPPQRCLLEADVEWWICR